MAVELKRVNMSLSDFDRCILLEGFGCSFDENPKAQVFKYGHAEVILILDALAKKLLGIYGCAIGNDPRRADRLGLSNGTRDFKEERRRAKKDMNKTQFASFTQRLDKEETFVKKLDAEFDGPAWRSLIELSEILSRRAMALHRAGLVVYNVGNMSADEAEQRDKLQGGTGEAPMEGSVALTEKGARCVSTQRFPKLKKRQRGDAHQFDFDVELPQR